MDPKVFPKNFLWGASMSSHQVEGGTVNQWSEWELANAKQLARGAAKRLSWVPAWREIRAQAQDPSNYVSGRGVEHVRRYEGDFDIAQKLHFNSLRVGIEWARLQPEEGAWNLRAIQHYHRYIKAMRDRGLEPILTLWHWTEPVWFAKKGGFSKKANVSYFEQFVKKVAEEYGDEVRFIITLNEPNVYTAFGYLTGEWPPQQKSLLKAIKVYRNLVRAHKQSYKILKQVRPALQVGVAAQISNMKSYRMADPFARLAAAGMSYLWNWWFLDRIKRTSDFIGLNYYFTDYYSMLLQKHNPTAPVSDLGWYMEPEGIFPVLMRMHQRYKLPIIITENGLADAKDSYRRWWIEQTIVAMQRALSQGVDLRGYLHWSLLDNFEWAYGWWPKFGLIEVDRAQGMQRTVRKSALWYGQYVGRLRRFHARRSEHVNDEEI